MEEIQKRIFEQFMEAFQSPIVQIKTAVTELRQQVPTEYKEINLMKPPVM